MHGRNKQVVIDSIDGKGCPCPTSMQSGSCAQAAHGGGTAESKSPGEAAGDDLVRHPLASKTCAAKHDEIH